MRSMIGVDGIIKYNGVDKTVCVYFIKTIIYHLYIYSSADTNITIIIVVFE